jgi:predicted NAD/FAD-binding protein
LTTAYLLVTRSKYEVHLFEKAERIGVDAASVDVNVINNEGKSVDVGIDVPMRSIDAGNSLGLVFGGN